MTKDEFARWLCNQTTREVFTYMKKRVEDCKTLLGNGGTLHDSAELTMKDTARMVGAIEGMEELMNLEHEDMKEEDF